MRHRLRGSSFKESNPDAGSYTVTGFDTDIIIVGGGPCGLMLANELGRRGVRAVVFNEGPDITDWPKANATQARTMEHFRRLGFVDEVRAAGLPPDYPTDLSYYTRYTGWELARFKLPSAAEAREMIRKLSGSWSAAELPHRVSQRHVERVLKRHAEALPSITLNYGWHVTAVADHGDHVTASAERAGEAVTVTGRYLVGCDGASSLIRKHLGIDLTGEAGTVRDFMGGRMHMVHIRAPHFYDEIVGDRAWMYWAFNRERRAFMPALDGKSEFVLHTQLRADETDESITDAAARALVHQCYGRPVDFEIVTRKSWTAGFTLVAERMAEGRIFLAGDAAHLFTPTGGLGYNTAVEDAVNLGWKFAAVLNGWGGEELLASYEAERRPNAVRNTGYARGFADSIGGYVAKPELEDDTPEGAAARAEAGAYLEDHARREFNIPGITFGSRYDGSPLIVGDGTSPPPDEANAYTPTACPGGRAPHLWLNGEVSLFDRFGFEFSLLRFNGRAETEGLERAAVAHGLPLTVVDVPGDEARETYDADYALVRPDQIVAWRGDEVPDDPVALIDKVRGA